MLLKAHGIDKRNALSSLFEFGQLHPGPVWQGLALDLLLGNIEQDFWGWSDPNAVYLLEYWRKLDPDLKFVLVYADPDSALQYNEMLKTSPLEVSQQLKEWQSFNESILEFYNRNVDCCVLVHAHQAKLSVNSYLQQVRIRLDAPLIEPVAYASAKGGIASETGKDVQMLQNGGAVNLSNSAVAAAGSLDALGKYLAKAVLVDYPAIVDLYEELQAVASLPLQEIGPEEGYSALSAWGDLYAIRQSQSTLTRELSEQNSVTANELATSHKELGATKNQLEMTKAELFDVKRTQDLVQGDLHKALNQNEVLRSKASELQKALGWAQDDLRSQRAHFDAREQDLVESKKLLLLQSNTLQEELARLQTLEKELGEDLRTLKAEKNRKISLINVEMANLAEKMKTGIAREVGRLAEEQARVQALEQTKSELTSDNEFLLSQLHNVQEALEDLFTENGRLKEDERRRNPPLYGAANRVKQQLTYRLGATMVSQSQSFMGWISMPFALIRTKREFKRDREMIEGTKLPPIFKYQDATEADRVKRHLSYRLGDAMMRNSKTLSGWLKMPFALREAIRDFDKSKRNR